MTLAARYAFRHSSRLFVGISWYSVMLCVSAGTLLCVTDGRGKRWKVSVSWYSVVLCCQLVLNCVCDRWVMESQCQLVLGCVVSAGTRVVCVTDGRGKRWKVSVSWYSVVCCQLVLCCVVLSAGTLLCV